MPFAPAKNLIKRILKTIDVDIYRPSRSRAVSIAEEPQQAIPTGHATYDPSTHYAVPNKQSIFDPAVMATYCWSTHRVVPRDDVSVVPPMGDLDVMLGDAQTFNRTGPFRLSYDRYALSLEHLPPGSGICLDACTSSPQQEIQNRVERQGYQYVPVDLHGDGVLVKKEDLTAMSFENESIAAIISCDTLEHIVNFDKALEEMYRVLQKNGILILHVPCYFFQRPKGEPIKDGVDPWGHVTYMSGADLLTVVDRLGFIVLRYHQNLDYGAAIIVAVKNQDIKGPTA
jgi:SAM-dependent methyltransferase